MSDQDTTSQDLFGTARCSRKKEETKQKTIKIYGSATKGLISMEHVNFTMKKKFYKKDLTLNPRTSHFFLTRSSPSQKLSFLEDPSELLKRPLFAVQKSCSSLQRTVTLSLLWVPDLHAVQKKESRVLFS